MTRIPSEAVIRAITRLSDHNVLPRMGDGVGEKGKLLELNEETNEFMTFLVTERPASCIDVCSSIWLEVFPGCCFKSEYDSTRNAVKTAETGFDNARFGSQRAFQWREQAEYSYKYRNGVFAKNPIGPERERSTISMKHGSLDTSRQAAIQWDLI